MGEMCSEKDCQIFRGRIIACDGCIKRQGATASCSTAVPATVGPRMVP